MAKTDPSRLKIPADKTYRTLDAGKISSRTTRDVPPLAGTIGQPRAVDAIRMGAEFKNGGYNLFVCGKPGSGRETTVRTLIEEHARKQPIPQDWVYVHHFSDPECPSSISLPAGLGRTLADDMDEFIRFAKREIPKAFETETYEKMRREAVRPLHQTRNELIEDLKNFSEQHHVSVEASPAGFVSVPLKSGKPIPTTEFEKLTPEEREEVEKRTREVQARIHTTARTIKALDKEEHATVERIDRDIARFALGSFFEELAEKYREHERVLKYLKDVQEDLLNHLEQFRSGPGQDETDLAQAFFNRQQKLAGQDEMTRYRVNVLVDNSQTRGAPVVFEKNPTYYNLFGKISFRGTFGAMVTSLMEIEAGALLCANGGFLVLEAIDVLRNPFCWEALKRTLLAHRAKIENLGEQLTPVPVATLRPDPIPLEVRVILIGEPWLYSLLYTLDPQFQRLFKIKADFSPEMEWNPENIDCYVAFVARVVRDQHLLEFSQGGLARVVEHGARLCGDQRKLTTRLKDIADIVTESSFWASKAGHSLVDENDVEVAIEKKEYRSNLLETKIREMIADGTIMIDTENAKVGQVNGLSVHDLGDYAFGRPSRISVSVGLGKDALHSIDRDSKLSGRIHSKGFMILSGYFRGKYALELPLALSATIAFEQSYGEVEGDSASSTELYALISALADVPLAQGIAVTGSVNQSGEIQAIGGINEKIEGFFSVCEAKGLNGAQGVLFPAANLPHLMLKKKVRDAIEAGRFHLWAVRTVDEGLRVLTGLDPDESIHPKVQERLRHLADVLRKFSAPVSPKEEPPPSLPKAA